MADYTSTPARRTHAGKRRALHWLSEKMRYHGRWNSTAQIPRRLVDGGMLDRLGFIDSTLGGESHRYSPSFN